MEGGSVSFDIKPAQFRFCNAVEGEGNTGPLNIN